jgi:hypothetical protein
MSITAEDFEHWLLTRTDEEWDQIAAAARRAGVGSWRWEAAWLAAGAGSAEGAVFKGRDPVARAAALGALAALRSGIKSKELLAPFVAFCAHAGDRNREPAACV